MPELEQNAAPYFADRKIRSRRKIRQDLFKNKCFAGIHKRQEQEIPLSWFEEGFLSSHSDLFLIFAPGFGTALHFFPHALPVCFMVEHGVW